MRADETPGLMQTLFVLGPLAAFFIAFKLAGIYVATAVLMAAMAIVLAIDYLRGRRIPPLHAVSAALIFVLGAATLLLHDERFIKWKPTVFLWLLGFVFLASTWIGERPFAQRLLSGALGEETSLPRKRWVALNFAWVVFYFALGAANLFVAFRVSTDAWVVFKMFGLTGATFVFVLLQSVWLVKAGKVPARG